MTLLLVVVPFSLHDLIGYFLSIKVLVLFGFLLMLFFLFCGC